MLVVLGVGAWWRLSRRIKKREFAEPITEQELRLGVSARGTERVF